MPCRNDLGDIVPNRPPSSLQPGPRMIAAASSQTLAGRARGRVQDGLFWALGARRGPREHDRLQAVVEGRVVLVTGASEGIGAAVARDCAAAGATVLLVARTRERLDAVRDQIVAAGGTAHVHPADLSDMDDVGRLAEEVLAAHGHVDVLVNNAGRSIRRGVAETVDRFHDVERVTQLNYFGAVRLTLALLPTMLERGRGHVVQVSTLGTLVHVPRFSAYLGAKAALEQYSRILATEVAPAGVSVSVVHMPLVRTAMIAPTRLFERTPAMSPAQGASLVTRAIRSRPRQVSMGLRPVATIVDAVLPGAIQSAWVRVLRR